MQQLTIDRLNKPDVKRVVQLKNGAVRVIYKDSKARRTDKAFLGASRAFTTVKPPRKRK